MSTLQLGNLAALLDLNARSRPSHPAIIHGDRRLDHRTFAASVRKTAHLLSMDGVGRGDFIGLALRDNIEHLLIMFALMRVGAVIVPFDHRWTENETISLASHFNVRILVVEPDAPTLAGIRHIVVDDNWRNRLRGSPQSPSIAHGEDLPMILSLSSGTTGQPTGPLLTHGQMHARMENQLAALTFHQHDRYLLTTPLYFGGGRAFALTHLLIGATLVLFPPPFDAKATIAAVREHSISSTFLVPTMLRRLLEEPNEALAGLSSLRLLISSGAPLHADERIDVTRRLCPGFLEYFASTEGGGITVSTAIDRQRFPDSVGRAGFRIEVEVVDDNHTPTASGEIGRIRYRGPGVAKRFHNNPGKSREAFHDGWFYPGDLGSLNDEGYLTLIGRAKNVIIRGGVNIYPMEIEKVLEAHPSVAEAAVFGIPDQDLGEVIHAAIVATADTTASELNHYCREHLARYKCPSRFDMVKGLPRNSAGKVLLDQLRKQLSVDRDSTD